MLKQLMLQRQRTALNAKIKALRAQRKALSDKEKKLQRDVEGSEEISEELEQQIEQLTEEQTQVDDQLAEALDKLDEIQEKLDEIDAGTAADPADEDEGDDEDRSREPAPSLRSRQARGAAPESRSFNCRSRMFTSRAQRDAFYRNENVAAFLGRVRSMLGNQPKGQRRSVTGAELTIPTEVLDILRDNANLYSKLAKYVRSRQVRGTARQQIVGDNPEGVWMEMDDVLNELSFAISEVEVDGFAVGGVIILPNYLLKDSDIALGEEILFQLGQAIGYARDKAYVYGKGKSSKMPLGFVTRLAQTSKPADWNSKRRDWVDLHSTNILKLNIGSETGASFFVPLLTALAKAKTKCTDGERVWVMNEATKIEVLIKSLGIDSAAAIVAGMNDTMPIIGGHIETLEFMPDKTIAGGCLGAYLEVEREGSEFGFSDLPLYIQNKTVFKGVARYDGLPLIDEDFVIVNYNNVDVTTSLDFATDYANADMNVLICTAAAHGSTSGKTVVTVSGAKADSPTLKYAVRYGGPGIKVGDALPSGFESLTSGSTGITAAAGTPITVVELDADSRVVSLGTVNSVPKA